jgi:hypothetical protein
MSGAFGLIVCKRSLPMAFIRAFRILAAGLILMSIVLLMAGQGGGGLRFLDYIGTGLVISFILFLLLLSQFAGILIFLRNKDHDRAREIRNSAIILAALIVVLVVTFFVF